MIDLHTHTTYSDGKLSPDDLLTAAGEKGLTHIAITDHDNDEAFKKIAGENTLANRRDVLVGDLQLVTGVEFSCRWDNIDVHVVALNYRSGSQSIEALLATQGRTRAERNLKIRKKLMAAGVDLAFDELEIPTQCRRLGRVYFAEKLVAAGLVKNTEKAFKRYLGKSGRAYVKSAWADLKHTIDATRSAGGSVVLAHPLKYKTSRGKLRKLVREFAELGGHGIEVISGQQVNTETDRVVRLAEEHGLKASVGSDFHAPGRPWSALGVSGYLPKRCTPVWRDWENLKF